jgi:Glycosyltransferase family 87
MTSDLTAEALVPSESAERRPFVFDGWWGAALLLLLVACSLWQMHVHNRIMQPSYSDLVTRWVGTRAALAGKDPYSDELLPEMHRMYYGHYPLTATDPDPIRQKFYYPAHMVVLLAPLAYLPWPIARGIFLAITVLLLALGFWCCMRMYRRRYTRSQLAMVLVLTLCSWPVLWGLRLQQPTLLIAAFIFLACFCLNSRLGSVAGVLLAFATVKPQIVLPIVAWLFLWAIVNRRWNLFVSFAITLAVLLLCAERIVPHWIPHWRASLGGYGHVTDTALPLENLFGHWVGLTLTILIAGSICISLWRLRRYSADSVEFSVAISLALALTVLVIPTHLTIIYNQVLLFPACLFLVYVTPADRDSRIARWSALALLVLTFALTPMAVLGETMMKPSMVWDAMPFLNNSPMTAGIALALAVIVSRGLKQQPGNAASSSPLWQLLSPMSDVTGE